MTQPDTPHVAILMCTRNGARFLPAQLRSLQGQDHENWSLWVSDDGSADNTRDILRDFQTAHPDRTVNILRGPRQGIGANFLSLMCHSAIPDGMVAFADQDDVWLPQKLSRGVAMLCQRGHGRPTLYASAYTPVDADLTPLAMAQKPVGGLRFRDALRRNRLCGATMIVPRQTLALVRRIGPRAVPFHDWWLNLLVTGMGGDILFDPQPSMLYRQHGGNALGVNIGLRAWLQRVGLVARGDYRDWHHINHTTLEEIWYELEPCSFTQLKQAMQYCRNAPPNPKVRYGAQSAPQRPHHPAINPQAPHLSAQAAGQPFSGHG